MITARMASLGPQFGFLVATGSQALTRVIMNCHDRYVQRRALRVDAATGEEVWRRSLSPEESDEWHRVIAADVQQMQRDDTSQAAFSDAYVEGHTSKRRRVAIQKRVPRDKPLNLTNGIRKQVQRAIEQESQQQQQRGESQRIDAAQGRLKSFTLFAMALVSVILFGSVSYVCVCAFFFVFSRGVCCKR